MSLQMIEQLQVSFNLQASLIDTLHVQLEDYRTQAQNGAHTVGFLQDKVHNLESKNIILDQAVNTLQCLRTKHSPSFKLGGKARGSAIFKKSPVAHENKWYQIATLLVDLPSALINEDDVAMWMEHKNENIEFPSQTISVPSAPPTYTHLYPELPIVPCNPITRGPQLEANKVLSDDKLKEISAHHARIEKEYNDMEMTLHNECVFSSPLCLDWPLDLDKWVRPMCTMLVDGEKINTLIDTGAAATLISGTPKTGKFTTACIVGVTGMPKTVYVEPRTLKIGSKTIRSDMFLEKDALSLLGAPDIVKFGFIIDLMNHMLWNIEGSTSPSEHTRIGLGSNLPPVHVVYPHEGIKIKHPPVDTESWWHEYADVWAKDSLDCGKSQLMVSLDGSHHPYVKQYPIPREAEKDLEVIIDQLLQRGLIRPCQTGGSSPVWPIRKKDITWCLTIDYRRLNETVFRTAPVVASYPEPIAKLTPEMQYYTVLDLANGFYSVQVTPETQYRTAFSFQSKQYCWTVLPQGYCDSPAIFHSMLAQALKSHNLHNKIVQYVDDLLIANDSRESNIKLLKKVLESLKKHGLKLYPDKCQLV
ncbi:NYNRIN-like [Pelobates cultripes]|uniref:ribonuclease H n=1 Tax=Pelobates cultripes TaxID=61616 RepID=A0AAD1RTM5_PELCU|nr:NYNRIN-like [Pelobates cultripes]